MNTQSSAVPESFDRQEVTPAVMSATRPLYWSVRRELWEFRSIYIAPLVAAAVVLFGFLISSFAGIWERALSLDPSQPKVAEPYNFAALLIMGSTFLVSLFYCLEALHAERRDRSILFWKSLPVSDLTTVLSKATIPLVILPLLTFAIIAATQWIMLLISIAVLSVSGQSVAALWNHLSLFQMWVMMLYHLVAIHSLWYAPFYGWLLLVSAWARRAPLLWAFLPPLAIGIFEKIAFRTSHFAAMLGHRFGGGPEGTDFAKASTSMNPLMHLSPLHFLISPGLWIGLAITAAFLATAIQLRRYRGPI
jgi:ABC-2 type transport system permease protein